MGTSNDALLAQVRAVMRARGNEACADCRSRLPRWASVNLGVFVCIKCSGQHRAIGTRYSRIRSTSLDDWIDEWAEVCCTGWRVSPPSVCCCCCCCCYLVAGWLLVVNKLTLTIMPVTHCRHLQRLETSGPTPFSSSPSQSLKKLRKAAPMRTLHCVRTPA